MEKHYKIYPTDYTYTVIANEQVWDGTQYHSKGTELEVVADLIWEDIDKYILLDEYTGRSFTYNKKSFDIK